MKNDDSVDLSAPCGHVAEIEVRTVERPAKGCVECLKVGGHWVHTRARRGEG